MSTSSGLAGQPARILIVDDERENRALLEVMLAPEGFVLETACNGEEALAAVERQPPDLILLDIVMPGMDGYEVARHGAPVGIVHVGLDGRCHRVNQRLCDLLGYSAEVLQSLSGKDVSLPEDASAQAEVFRRVAEGTLHPGRMSYAPSTHVEQTA
jgi:PAS domain-containing protein